LRWIYPLVPDGWGGLFYIPWFEPALVKVFVLGCETVDLGSLPGHEAFQIAQLRTHFLPDPEMLVFAGDTALVFGEDPRGGVLPQLRATVTPRADKIIRGFSMP
jgi:hypothetical protein